jgi:hypothetical protein
MTVHALIQWTVVLSFTENKISTVPFISEHFTENKLNDFKLRSLVGQYIMQKKISSKVLFSSLAGMCDNGQPRVSE